MIQVEMKKSGFSILEALTSMFVLAVVVGIMSMPFINISPKYQLKKAVWEVNSRMHYARYKAIFDGVKYRIKFGPTSYVVEKYNEIQNKWICEQTFFLEAVSIQANNSPTFHPKGTVSNLATIIISNSGGEYKITLAISGRIKVVQIK